MPILNLVQECSERAASWTSGDYIASAALVAASLTAYIAYRAYRASIKQLEQNRRHNELSVRPLLDFEVDIWQPDNVAGIWLANHGYGAAVLKALGATLNGADYDLLDPLAQREFSNEIPKQTHYEITEDFNFLTEDTHRDPDSAIPHGTKSSLLLIVKDPTYNFRASFHAAKGLKLWAKYEDLYGNTFSASFDNNRYESIPVEEILGLFKQSTAQEVAQSGSVPKR